MPLPSALKLLFFFLFLILMYNDAYPTSGLSTPFSDARNVGSKWLKLAVQITSRGDDQPAAAFAHFFPHGRICPMAGCMPAPPVTLHSHFFPCDKRQRPLHRTGRIPAGLAGPGGPHKSASCMLGGCSLEGREAFLQAVNFKRDIDNESISRTVSYKVCPGTVSIK
jgi:hypothetical protein